MNDGRTLQLKEKHTKGLQKHAVLTMQARKIRVHLIWLCCMIYAGKALGFMSEGLCLKVTI